MRYRPQRRRRSTGRPGQLQVRYRVCRQRRRQRHAERRRRRREVAPGGPRGRHRVYEGAAGQPWRRHRRRRRRQRRRGGVGTTVHAPLVHEYTASRQQVCGSGRQRWGAVAVCGLAARWKADVMHAVMELLWVSCVRWEDRGSSSHVGAKAVGDEAVADRRTRPRRGGALCPRLPCSRRT